MSVPQRKRQLQLKWGLKVGWKVLIKRVKNYWGCLVHLHVINMKTLMIKIWSSIISWHRESFAFLREQECAIKEPEIFWTMIHFFKKKRYAPNTAFHPPSQQYFKLFIEMTMKLLIMCIWVSETKTKKKTGPWNWFLTLTFFNSTQFSKIGQSQ